MEVRGNDRYSLPRSLVEPVGCLNALKKSFCCPCLELNMDSPTVSKTCRNLHLLISCLTPPSAHQTCPVTCGVKWLDQWAVPCKRQQMSGRRVTSVTIVIFTRRDWGYPWNPSSRKPDISANILTGRWDCSVGIVYGLPARGIYLSTPRPSDRFWGPRRFAPRRYQWCILGGKAAGARSSSLSSACCRSPTQWRYGPVCTKQYASWPVLANSGAVSTE
jgi:hypothetical protein